MKLKSEPCGYQPLQEANSRLVWKTELRDSISSSLFSDAEKQWGGYKTWGPPLKHEERSPMQKAYQLRLAGQLQGKSCILPIKENGSKRGAAHAA